MTLDTLIGKNITLVAYSNALDIEIGNNYYTEYATCTFLKYKFDDKLYILKIIENPEDGYRSSLGVVNTVNETDVDYQKAVFQILPPAKVILKYYPDKNISESDDWSRKQNVYEFIDDIETVWFTFGTDNIEDYYPSYFCFHPDINLKAYREAIIGNILDD